MRDKIRILRRIALLEARHRRDPVAHLSKEELHAKVSEFVAKIRALPDEVKLENASEIASTLGDWDKVRPQFAALTDKEKLFYIETRIAMLLDEPIKNEAKAARLLEKMGCGDPLLYRVKLQLNRLPYWPAYIARLKREGKLGPEPRSEQPARPPGHQIH
jgi:hypothetical protein